MKDEATPGQLAMARRICANACGIGKIGRACAADFLSGRADDGTDMAIALAAIIETQRLDAGLADGHGLEGSDEALTADCIAAAIRAGKHYGKDQQ